MINIIFPPGCYGTYVGRCLLAYTDLSKISPFNFSFDENGSSHELWALPWDREKIKLRHTDSDLENLEFWKDTVLIMPNNDHLLDYIDNQYAKHFAWDLLSLLETCFTKTAIEEKFSSWGYVYPVVPKWAIRENISLWVSDLMASTSEFNYSQVNSSVKLYASEIFDNFLESIHVIVSKLGLTLTTSDKNIVMNHNKFQSAQKFHGAQFKCINWSKNVFTGDLDAPSPCQTIFDEAYVQHLLRNAGYEIQCYELDQFPTTAFGLRKLIYKV